MHHIDEPQRQDTPEQADLERLRPRCEDTGGGMLVGAMFSSVAISQPAEATVSASRCCSRARFAG